MKPEELADRLTRIHVALTDAIPDWAMSGEVVIVLSKMASDIAFDALSRHPKRRPTKDAPDLGESAASDNESNPAPKRVI